MSPPQRTSHLLRDLRSVRVVVFHPNDQDGQEIARQLQRIGCQVKAYWPPLERLPQDSDVVFLAVRPEIVSLQLPWAGAEDMPPLIAVVNYENPTIVDAVLKAGADGVIASPVKSFGLLTTIVVARQTAANRRAQRKLIGQLEQRLAGIRKLNKAKAILVQTRGISEEEAYAIIREQAMSKRTTTDEIANAIINANEILGFRPRPAVVREFDVVDNKKPPRERGGK